MITQARLKEVLNYDPETGEFVWAKTRLGRAVAGKRTGYRCKGSIDIRVDGKLHRAHRLAWLYVHGELPELDIDHINGDPFDNRIVNLRHVTHEVNMQNMRRPQGNNKLGLQGVSAWGKRFKVRLRIAGMQVKIGAFDTPEEAHAAYLDAKRQFHEGCTI